MPSKAILLLSSNTHMSPLDFNVKSHNSPVIRQKGESQNGGNKKTKHVKFSEKMNISYPLIRTQSK